MSTQAAVNLFDISRSLVRNCNLLWQPWGDHPSNDELVTHNRDSLHMQNNPHNFNIAYLDQTEDSVIIIIMGRRRYMGHDLASALKDHFYIDRHVCDLLEALGWLTVYH